MSRRTPLLAALISQMLLGMVGCHPQQPFYLGEDGDLSHYLGVATDIEYPDVAEESLAEVEGSVRPFSLDNPDQEKWELTLEEAVRTALANGSILRSIGGQIQGPPDFLLRNADLAPTVYDPAIIESNPRFGTEAALAAFDTQFTSSVFWEKNDAPRNSFAGLGTFFPREARQDLGTFQAQLQKTTATGGTWTLRHNVNYDAQPDVPRIFGSDWNVNVEAEMRQPLLRGNGVQLNRITGPGAIPGFNNGVMIARINSDITLAEFEAGVRDMVFDVELAYWELYFAYRNLDAVKVGRDSGLQTWREVKAKYDAGHEEGSAHDEAQARQQYFQFLAELQRTQSDLYAKERKLRYMLGLAPTDGRLIKPIDEPTKAKVTFNWEESNAEALCRSPELRQQKWMVKKRQLELISAKNYLLPRLDAVARYRWLGMGDDLISANNTSNNKFGYAYESMTSGEFQESQFGLELSIPLGFRKEMVGVRHAQLNLAKEKKRLQEMELELLHQLGVAVQEAEDSLSRAGTLFNRRVAAKDEVDAAEASYRVGVRTWTLDRVLDSQRRRAIAESEYYRALVDYNLAIARTHLRKGSLLEYNGVQLSEGPWPGKAYFDARRRARARDASLYLDYGFTRPKVISRGAVEQQAGAAPMVLESEVEESVPTESAPELIPAPMPEPIEASPEPAVPVPTPAEDHQARGPEIGVPSAAPTPLTSTPRGGRSATPAFAPRRAGGEDGWSAMKAARPRISAATGATDGTSATATSTSAASRSDGKWTGSKRSGSRHESDANPPAAKAPRFAAVWNSVQR